MDQKPLVKASEIGEYVYCPRAWWLRFSGIITGKTEAMIAGTTKHEQLATRLETNTRGMNLAWLLIFLGVVLLFGLFLIFLLLK